MKLLQATIDNIRSHRHFVFEPDLAGTTAISGVNGAGKSTIVNSISWCLFGPKSLGYKNKGIIREGVDPTKELVAVSVIIVVGDREYKVERKIINKSGQVQCSVYSRPLNSTDEFNLDCGPSVTHTEVFIKKLLGHDEKGWYSSVFVQQKQVDQIISASPRERGAIIEQMIGISAITTAIDMAKEESKGLQKALSVIQPGSVEDEEKKVEEQKQLVLSLSGSIKNVEERLAQANENLTAQKSRYEEETIIQNKVSELKQSLQLIDNDVKNLRERLEAQVELCQQESDTGFSEDVWNDLTKELEYAKNTLTTLQQKLAITSERKKQFEDLYSVKIKESVQEDYNTLHAESEELQQMETNTNAESGVIVAKIKNTKQYLKDLECGTAICPYCHTPIEDIDQERERHNHILQELYQEYEENKKIIDNIVKNKAKTLDELLKLQQAIEVARKQEQNKTEYANTKKEFIRLQTEIDTTSVVISKLEQRHGKMIESKAKSDNIKQAKAILGVLNERLSMKLKEKIEVELLLSELTPLTLKEYRGLEVGYINSTKEVSATEMELSNLKKDLEIAKIRGREYVLQLKECKRVLEEYTKLSHELAMLNQSIKLLADFKDLRTKTSIPSLTNIASEILNRFTDGVFTEIRLSEKFEASIVTSTGIVRPVADLSGGELSAVAIALRLAIAIFLHDGNQSLLILDEVLVSMSEERTQNILETISTITGAQIILIAHSDVANSFADTIVQL